VHHVIASSFLTSSHSLSAWNKLMKLQGWRTVKKEIKFPRISRQNTIAYCTTSMCKVEFVLEQILDGKLEPMSKFFFLRVLREDKECRDYSCPYWPEVKPASPNQTSSISAQGQNIANICTWLEQRIFAPG
jgi:hypothetical protein